MQGSHHYVRYVGEPALLWHSQPALSWIHMKYGCNPVLALSSAQHDLLEVRKLPVNDGMCYVTEFTQ